MILQKIISIYKDYQQSYIEHHDVVDGRIEAGKPINAMIFRQMFNDYIKSPQDNIEWIPKNLIAKGPEFLLWLHPAQKKTLTFEEMSGDFFCPNLLFMFKNNNVYVFATKTQDISPDTPLFCAPFPNRYKSGNMCMGNTKIPKEKTIIKQIDTIENAFFTSQFTHFIDPSTDKPTMLLWKNALNTPFDDTSLLSAKMKVQDLI